MNNVEEMIDELGLVESSVGLSGRIGRVRIEWGGGAAVARVPRRKTDDADDSARKSPAARQGWRVFRFPSPEILLPRWYR